jgi:hypothetical protein
MEQPSKSPWPSIGIRYDAYGEAMRVQVELLKAIYDPGQNEAARVGHGTCISTKHDENYGFITNDSYNNKPYFLYLILYFLI